MLPAASDSQLVILLRYLSKRSVPYFIYRTAYMLPAASDSRFVIPVCDSALVSSNSQYLDSRIVIPICDYAPVSSVSRFQVSAGI